MLKSSLILMLAMMIMVVAAAEDKEINFKLPRNKNKPGAANSSKTKVIRKLQTAAPVAVVPVVVPVIAPVGPPTGINTPTTQSSYYTTGSSSSKGIKIAVVVGTKLSKKSYSTSYRGYRLNQSSSRRMQVR